MKVLNVVFLMFFACNLAFAQTQDLPLSELGTEANNYRAHDLESINRKHHSSSDFTLGQKIAMTVAITGLLLVMNDQRGFPGDIFKGFSDGVFIGGGVLAIGALIYFDQKKKDEEAK